jgi:hypothetical protein
MPPKFKDIQRELKKTVGHFIGRREAIGNLGILQSLEL